MSVSQFSVIIYVTAAINVVPSPDPFYFLALKASKTKKKHSLSCYSETRNHKLICREDCPMVYKARFYKALYK